MTREMDEVLALSKLRALAAVYGFDGEIRTFVDHLETLHETVKPGICSSRNCGTMIQDMPINNTFVVQCPRCKLIVLSAAELVQYFEVMENRLRNTH